MNYYDTVLFDLDGTLTDPGEGITNAVAYALEKFGVFVEDKTTLYRFIGPRLYDSFSTFYGFSEQEAKQAVDYYREYYSEKGIYENKPIDGMEELLKALKTRGKVLAVATSKPERYAEQVIEMFHMTSYFSLIVGGKWDGTRMKKKEVIHDALSGLHVTNLEKAVMIGDRRFDVIGASQEHIDSIGVLYGYGTEEELVAAGATMIAKTTQDLNRLLR